MFLTYLGRELRRRARQASIIALGLALGIGLVITVTALSSGVKNAQGEVLHSLYGQDTDITVSKTPKASSSGSPFTRFRFNGTGSGSKAKAGTTINVDNLTSTALGTLTNADVSKVAGLKNVAAAAGGLTLTDTKTTFKIPSQSSSGSSGFPGAGGGGGGGGSFGRFKLPPSISVDGTQVNGSGVALGPLSSAKLSSGRTFKSSDATADVALVDANYAKTNKLKVGSTVTLAKTKFTIVGIVSQSAASSPPDVYIPLQRAQTLGTSAGKSLKGEVNTIYVASSSAQDITTVSKDISTAIPGSTVTNQNDLAKELTGSVASASSLANNLGKWLAIAVLAAAFLLAVLLTSSAVARRVREFGTLKALGWTSRRVVGQVVGEAITIGVIGGIVGVGLGFLGSSLVSHFSHSLTATLAGSTTGSATPGGARTFTGGGFPGGGSGGFPGGGGGGFPGAGGFRTAAASHPVTVHLVAQVTGSAIAAAVVLAIVGGLIAGGFGGWRAARLRPAAALARVE
jgi:putative ABC transport system permease protein